MSFQKEGEVVFKSDGEAVGEKGDQMKDWAMHWIGGECSTRERDVMEGIGIQLSMG